MSEASNIADPKPDRRARRREETRAKLLDSARRLFGVQGVDATRINEITEGADVGFGSFYNYFEDKEAIAQAVMAETLAREAGRIAEATTDLEDPAEVVSVAHRHFVRLARSDPEWARLLVRMDDSHDVAREKLGPFARRDLDSGLESGRFQVADPEVALFATGGALLSIMEAVLQDLIPEASDVIHAEGVLRLLGLTPEEAREVANRPFPDVSG